MADDETDMMTRAELYAFDPVTAPMDQFARAKARLCWALNTEGLPTDVYASFLTRLDYVVSVEMGRKATHLPRPTFAN